MTVCIAAVAIGCRREQVLRRADAINLRVERRDAHTLVVSGGIFHSGLQIDRIRQTQAGHRRVIRIYLGAVQPGAKSDFRFLVPLSATTDEVYLGDASWGAVI